MNPRLEKTVAAAEQVLAGLRRDLGTQALTRVERMLWGALGLEPVTDRAPLQRAQKFHYPGLPNTPFFDVDAPGIKPITDVMRAAVPMMREEYLAARAANVPMPDYFAPYRALGAAKFPGVKEDDWTILYLRDKKERRAEPGASLCPRTDALLASLDAERFPLSEVYFSRLAPGARLPRHSDTTNAKVNMHVALIVPEGCGIEVGGETRHWVEGDCLGFDDSFLHSAWNTSTRERVVLIVDFWRPELTPEERIALRALFTLADDLEPLLVPPPKG